MNADLILRFWAKVDRRLPDECWNWLASTNGRGYGRFGIGSSLDGTRRLVYAHRLAYELLVGPIPDGLTIDHLCRNHGCVNPAHLEPVTNLENHRRGKQAQQTHCERGHAFDEENTYVDPRGWRECRACRAARGRRQRNLGLAETTHGEIAERTPAPKLSTEAT